MIQLGPWLPDLPDLNNPGLTTAKNVIPHEISYKQFLGLSTVSDACDDRVRGAIVVRDSNGNAYHFAGNASKLYRMVDNVQTDYSITGGYTTGANEIWQFVQWGDTVIATNYSDNIQQITLGGTQFADLATSGTAPKARTLGVVKGFVVVGNTYDGTDGAVPYRVWWPAIENPNSWPTPGSSSAVSVQSDYQDIFNGGGAVMGIIGGEYGTIIQERAISRMTYIGTPDIFQFDTVDVSRGTIAPGSVVQLGRGIFYIAEDGFFLFDGIQSVPIGVNKVDKTFISDLNSAYYDRISAAVDPTNEVVMWAYPGSGSSGTADTIMIYHWPTQKWSKAVVDVEVLLKGYSLGYTLEGLDALSSSIDSLTYSLDSRAYTGGALQIGAYDSSHRYATFSGSALSAVFETAEYMLNPNQRTNLTSVTPYVDGGATTVQIGYRNTQAGSVTWGSAITPQTNEEAKCRVNAQYHRVRINAAAGFTHAEGVEITEASPAGRR